MQLPDLPNIQSGTLTKLDAKICDEDNVYTRGTPMAATMV
jgi:hypothetical protein